MGVMRTLHPAIEEPLPTEGWRLVAVDAGRYRDGLQSTIQLWNSTLEDTELIVFADMRKYKLFMRRVSAQAQCKPAQVRETLRRLHAAVEGQLRDRAAQREAHSEHVSQATQLVELAADAELWHTPGADGEAYATIEVDGHRETWPCKAKGFRRWLARQFFAAHEKAPGAQAVQDALAVLEGKALFDGPEYPVHTRLAEHEGAIYLDLADAHWRAVKITAAGWRVVRDAPVRFRRARGMLPLPCPVTGGRLDDLRQLLNIKDDRAWKLLKGYLVQLLNPKGPYPALIVHGEQGSAKSTLCRLLRALIDPNIAPLRAAPRDGRDLIIAATNGWVIALDNLSTVPDWLSDALCRLATGGGFATRELYSDGEEALFDAERPVLLNGIEELATRGDLLDRAIVIYLPSIPEAHRRPEAALWRDFEAQHPKILGALLDAVSRALRDRDTVELEGLPRMADFVIWVAAASDKLGMTPDDFLEAYKGNRSDANELALDAALIVSPLRDLLAAKDGAWEGIATELLHDLDAQAPERTRKAQGSPSNGRSLSNALRRVAPNLRQTGIDVTFLPGRRRGRLIHIERRGIHASSSSSSSPGAENQRPKEDVGGDARLPGGDDRGTHTNVEITSWKHTKEDSGDAEDAIFPPHSNVCPQCGQHDWRTIPGGDAVCRTCARREAS
jgi:hypothetical protein